MTEPVKRIYYVTRDDLKLDLYGIPAYRSKFNKIISDQKATSERWNIWADDVNDEDDGGNWVSIDIENGILDQEYVNAKLAEDERNWIYIAMVKFY